MNTESEPPRMSLYTTNVDPELAAAIEPLDPTMIPTNLDSIPAMRTLNEAILEQMEQVLPHSATVTSTDHRASTADAAEILIRVYRPSTSQAALPVLVWVHGGGMIAGSVAGDNWYCEAIVDGVGCAVASIDYRLAPEHPHPIPVEDCTVALRWVAAHADELNLDPARLAIGGASAGGGLAAGVVLKNRDTQGPPVSFQYLMYPMLDDRAITQSSQTFSGIPTWSLEHNENGWRALLGERYQTEAVDAYAAPARAIDLSGLPPTLIQVGELDTFRDEDIDYATRLLQAGVPTELHVYPGAYHGWDLLNPTATSTTLVHAERNRALIRALAIR
jgi:acetyl esterase/lipase